VRKAFINSLIELAAKDSRVVLLTGDLGFMALEPFAERYPDRFFNVGVSEQNMVGVATGLAESGYTPFVYSIATFATLRPYEFIRNGPVWHGFPVRIVGTGGGFEYGSNGMSHYALEDVALMRIQPGLTVIVPADHEQAGAAILKTSGLKGPVYYRLGKDDVTTVPGLKGRFELGRVQFIGEGQDLLMIVMGSIASEAATAVALLSQKNIGCTLGIVSNLNPDPVEDLVSAMNRFKNVITVEAHYRNGGLGSAISEIAAERGLKCRVTRRGVLSAIDGQSGSQSYMYKKHGLSAAQLAETALNALREGT
jgi:transketolase